jgi:hypothetical protein
VFVAFPHQDQVTHNFHIIYILLTDNVMYFLTPRFSSTVPIPEIRMFFRENWHLQTKDWILLFRNSN